jgi:Ni,Fe-hydrogenase III large subunit
MSAAEIIRAGAAQGCKPHERYLLTPVQWQALVMALREDRALELFGLWAEPNLVHAAFHQPRAGLLLASLPVQEGRFAALSPVRPGAVRFERMIRDLWGHVADGAVDSRPWLDHGRWPLVAPLAAQPGKQDAPPPQPEFLAAEGEGVHQIAVGPVHAGIIEPGHFRFHVQGETVVRLEQRLGYLHKGTLSLMLGKSPRLAARFAARLSGDSTVAHSWAFAMAAENALGVTSSPRAVTLRALAAELERIHNHLNDWGFICNDAAFAFPHVRCGALREAVLRACAVAFGHRLMMDFVVPGGVARDIAADGAQAIGAALAAVEREIPSLIQVYESHASLQDRVVGTGTVTPELAAAFAAGGHVGRAAGRAFDSRHSPGYAPYDKLGFSVKVLEAGDVDARLRIRVAELGQSIAMVRKLLDRLTPGELRLDMPQTGGEGVGLVEAFRGEALHWLQLDDGGLIRAVFMRDASWLQWPLLEAAIENNIVADFPLCNKSFNCSYSGVDL